MTVDVVDFKKALNDTLIKSIKGRLYTRLNYAQQKYVEFYSVDSDEMMPYQDFGAMLHNVFEIPEMWPRIGESVRDTNGNIYVVDDILTYSENGMYIKRFSIRKKTEQQTIVQL